MPPGRPGAWQGNPRVDNNSTDEAGFEAECQRGRRLGFDGKTLIHPRQVDVCNRVFAATAGQVADARAVIAAWEEAVAHGRGVVTVDGRMVANLHVDAARRLIAAHDAVQEFARLGT